MTKTYKSMDIVVSSVHADYATGDTHAILTVWNRHGRAGTLVVNAGDLLPMLHRLMPYGWVEV